MSGRVPQLQAGGTVEANNVIPPARHIPDVVQLHQKVVLPGIEKSGHLAWCTLVTLALAGQDGSVLSPAQENLFLIRWLATTLKQQRFSRDVAPDIEWLLKQGHQREAGQQAELPLAFLHWRVD